MSPARRLQLGGAACLPQPMRADSLDDACPACLPLEHVADVAVAEQATRARMQNSGVFQLTGLSAVLSTALRVSIHRTKASSADGCQ